MKSRKLRDSQRSWDSLSWDPRKHTPRHIIITLPKIKDKERILKAAREKEKLTTKEFPEDYLLISQQKPYRQEGAGKYSKS